MSDDSTDFTWWDRAKLNFWNLLQADKDEQFDETVGESMDKVQGVNYKTGLLINTATILVGAGVYQFVGGIIGVVGLVFAILSALSILKWVVQQ